MGKYDFVLDGRANDSHTIILSKIRSGAKVLEFGSANGKMTQYMKEELGCKVYIVEYNEDDYKEARVYAEDGICGDICKLEWLKWQNIGFDYVLFADVLEHLTKPHEILNCIAPLLSAEGKIVVSVPNVTHNDILIKAGNEHFDYTPLGLLDNTHVHFWGWENLKSLENDSLYSIEELNYTIWGDGTTEQAEIELSMMDRELRDVLSERRYGNVYQFIVTLGLKGKNSYYKEQEICNGETGKIYFDIAGEFEEEQGQCVYAEKIDYKQYKYDIDIVIPKGVSKVLFKPVIGCGCALLSLDISADLSEKPFCIFSECFEYENKVFFTDETPYIVINLTEKKRERRLVIQADLLKKGNRYAEVLVKGNKEIEMNMNEQFGRMDKRFDIIEKRFSIIEQDCQEEKNEIQRNTQDIQELNMQLNRLSDMLQKQKNDNFMNRIRKRIDENAYIIAVSSYFDGEWYINRYHLKIQSHMKAAKHYLEHGWKMLYDPSPYFSTVGYFICNWDVKEAGCNPLLHYEKDGKDEGRDLGRVQEIKEEYNLIKNSKYFDAEWYRQTYGIDEKTDLIAYYLFIGMGQYHNPSADFSVIDYLIDNRQFINSYQNPLVHFEKNKGYKKLIVKPVLNVANIESFDHCMNVNQDALAKLSKFDRVRTIQHKESVDIIICVYNAYEDVKKCIESVLKNTSEPYRIIVVDDNSAELTANYLREVAAGKSNFELIRNDSDFHGYTYAANIGLRRSTADFCVMLNSDTIVSLNWLDNMIACAKSDERIGVVGPLSNTASWQSVPKLTDDNGDWCHNVIPEGFSISETAELIEAQSEKIYPHVPLLNGFCMMIARKVIDTIGYFDEENFGRGFAEEDDYNTRAVKAGFELAIADDTYIFHAQSKSYSDARRLELCKLSGEALRKKHGQEYIDSCSTFMATNKILLSLRKRIETMYERELLIREAKKKYAGIKVLFLLPGSNASGGANVIIQESHALMAMGVNVKLLNVEGNRDAFEKAYSDLDIPVIWIANYEMFDYEIAGEFDIVVCTIFRTVRYCKFLENYDKPKVAYYIQDYEPYFIREEMATDQSASKKREYEEAVNSYTLLSNGINITKTQWNCNEVKEHTGADCVVVGPSVNLKQFVPRIADDNVPLVITAMIRPDTKRRGPQMTFDVLRQIKHEFENRVSIRIFGADPEKDEQTKFFFVKQKKDFEFINYGLTSPTETSRILSGTDIFIDLSEFQAMGLTAMEAMACGCATVVPVYGGTDCFAVDNENCLVIDTLDREVCLDAVRKLIMDRQLRTSLGKRACVDIAEKYPERVAKAFLDAIFDNANH